MPTLTTRDGTQIYDKDRGSGPPVVFSHGWPLSADAWESQMFYLASRGYRCIAHDRRGGSHALGDTSRDQLHADLLGFLRS
jgi:non-heme chloroperoxidase